MGQIGKDLIIKQKLLFGGDSTQLSLEKEKRVPLVKKLFGLVCSKKS